MFRGSAHVMSRSGHSRLVAQAKAMIAYRRYLEFLAPAPISLLALY